MRLMKKRISRLLLEEGFVKDITSGFWKHDELGIISPSTRWDNLKTIKRVIEIRRKEGVVKKPKSIRDEEGVTSLLIDYGFTTTDGYKFSATKPDGNKAEINFNWTGDYQMNVNYFRGLLEKIFAQDKPVNKGLSPAMETSTTKEYDAALNYLLVNGFKFIDDNRFSHEKTGGSIIFLRELLKQRGFEGLKNYVDEIVGRPGPKPVYGKFSSGSDVFAGTDSENDKIVTYMHSLGFSGISPNRFMKSTSIGQAYIIDLNRLLSTGQGLEGVKNYMEEYDISTKVKPGVEGKSFNVTINEEYGKKEVILEPEPLKGFVDVDNKKEDLVFNKPEFNPSNIKNYDPWTI